MRSDSRMQPVTGRRVDGYMFPKDIPFPDIEVTLAAGKLQVLGLQSDAGKRIKFVAWTNGRHPINHHMRMQPATVTEFHVRPDDTIRPNLTASAKLRL